MTTRIPPEVNIIEILENQDDIDEVIMQSALQDLVKASYFNVPPFSEDIFEVLIRKYFIETINKEFNDLLNSGDFELLKNIVLQSLNLSRFGERTQDGLELPR